MGDRGAPSAGDGRPAPRARRSTGSSRSTTTRRPAFDPAPSCRRPDPAPAAAAASLPDDEPVARRSSPRCTLGDPEALLDDLNPPQRRAVVHRGGPLLVVAGAGSGKTRVLTRRIAHLLATGDAAPLGDPGHHLHQQGGRRDAPPGGRAGRARWPSGCGCPPSTRPACASCAPTPTGSATARASPSTTTPTRAGWSRSSMRDLGLDTKRLPPRSVAAVIGQAKAELIDDEAVRRGAGARSDPFRRRIADVYLEYQQRLLAANAMDFDDLLLQAVRLLRTCDDVLAAYQQRFRHILVDEYQDTNRAQNELVVLLGRDHGNVCVVGDGDQSIYGFRGADIRNILEFEEAFPDATVVLLEQNYRSTQTILDAANAVIANNLARGAQAAVHRGRAGRADPPLPGRGRARRGGRGWPPRSAGSGATRTSRYGDVAIFYRTNAQSRVLEEELVRAGRPLQGGRRHPLLRPPRGEGPPGLPAAAGQPGRRGLGPAHRQRAQAGRGRHLGRPAGRLGRGQRARPSPTPSTARPRPGSPGRALRGAGELDGAARPSCAEADGPVAARRAGRRRWPSGPATWPSWWPSGSHEADGRLENIAELVGVAGEYDALDEFLESVALVSDSDELDADGSPGLAHDPAHGQGPRVPGRLPGRPGGRDLPPLPGPGRAARARGGAAALLRGHHPGPPLALPHPRLGADAVGPHLPQHPQPVPGRDPRRAGARRGARGVGGRPAARTRRSGRRGRSRDDLRRRTAGPAVERRPGRGPGPGRAPGPRGSGLAAGEAVVHDHWGEGVVVAAEGEGERAQATVRFASVGEKRLLLSATPLRRA